MILYKKSVFTIIIIKSIVAFLKDTYSYFEKGSRIKCTHHRQRYCGWFWVHCFSRKSERMAREAMDICLRVLKESNKSRFHSYSVSNSVLIIFHLNFRVCRMHIFSDNLSRNSCKKFMSNHYERSDAILTQWDRRKPVGVDGTFAAHFLSPWPLLCLSHSPS